MKRHLKSNCCHTVNISLSEERCIIVDVRTPKAIKPHVCDECKREIGKGEVYRREVVKYSDLFHHKMCADCLSVREVFFSSGWYFGGLWRDFEDFVVSCDGNISSSQLRMITKPARDKICDMLEEYWKDNY